MFQHSHDKRAVVDIKSDASNAQCNDQEVDEMPKVAEVGQTHSKNLREGNPNISAIGRPVGVCLISLNSLICKKQVLGSFARNW